MRNLLLTTSFALVLSAPAFAAGTHDGGHGETKPAAMMIGMPEDEYSDFMQDKTAVSKGSDFIFNNKRYQVKANRPSGKPGSKVTIVAKAKNYEWDYLIWLLYNKEFQIKESWIWNQHDYKKEFDEKKRLSPSDYRRGKKLF